MGYQVQAIFKISLHNKDYDLLCQIQDYFGVGSITKHGSTTLQYTVKSLKDLSIIISHFDKYPLIFYASSSISNLEASKKKLTDYKKKLRDKQINKGRMYSSIAHPQNNQAINPWFVSGFTDASKQKKLVVWGTSLTSTVGERFSRKEFAMVELAPYQYSVVIGLLLSDGWIIFASKTNKNARLGFKQSLARSYYVWFVFNQLSHYCSSYPIVTSGIRAGNRFYGLQIYTRSMPCITELRFLFYPAGVKIVPHNIYELLTPVALAHWIMGDGSAKSHGLILCTDSYSIEDTIRLINVLIIRYRLECTFRVHRTNQYRIYIRQPSMPSLLNIVSPYMHPSMLYKLKSSLSNSSNRKKIEVLDKDTNQITYYDSISEAAIALNFNYTSILYSMKSKKQNPYKGRYVFKLL